MTFQWNDRFPNACSLVFARTKNSLEAWVNSLPEISLVAGLGQNKTSAQVNQVTIGLFFQVPAVQRKTMTFDNGREFSGHAELSERLKIACYFANP